MDKLSQNKIMAMLQHGNIDQALDIMEKICGTDCDDPDSWLLLASIHATNKNYEGTRDCCRKSLLLDSGNFSANWNYAVAFENLGNIDSAIGQYKAVAKLFPNYVETYHRLGNLNYKLTNHQDAYDHYQAALKIDPDHIGATIGLGNALLELNRPEEAIDSYTKALRNDPELPEANFNLGTAYYRTNKYDLAIRIFKDLISKQPDLAEAYNSLGVALLENKDFKDAINAFNNAVKRLKNPTSAYTNLGNTYDHLGLFSKAVSCYEKALDIDPDYVPALLNLNNQYVALGDLDKAEYVIERAITLSPDNIESIVGKATILEKQGKSHTANLLLQPLYEKGINTTSFLLAYASLDINRTESETREMIDLLETVSSDKHRLLKERASIHYALGDLHDAQGAYDKAFNNYRVANHEASIPVNTDEDNIYIDNIISAFEHIDFSSQEYNKKQSLTPIFIIGMPRSGTSLIEQILSTNTDVFAGGELLFISELINSIPGKYSTLGKYPQCFTDMSERVIEELSAYYQNSIAELSGASKYVTDKMPINYMHLGMISLLFPDAKIIHCTRDPVDTCLSCYFTNMIGYPQFRNMNALGNFYNNYSRLMKFWENTLETPIFDVNYEQLIEDKESVTKDLMEFCELKWSPSCLEFYRNESISHTASYKQVRKPIYNNSIRRRDKYARYTSKLLSCLEL